MSFWKKWWKKKNKDKAGASEFEDLPLPAEVEAEQNEKARRAKRNNLSMSRSGRMKAKSRERSQLSDDLFQGANGTFVRTSANGEGEAGRPQDARTYPTVNGPAGEGPANGSFGKNSCREVQQQLVAQHHTMPVA